MHLQIKSFHLRYIREKKSIVIIISFKDSTQKISRLDFYLMLDEITILMPNVPLKDF